MSSEQVLEAAEMILPELLGIDSYDEALSRLVALSSFPNEEAKELETFAHNAAERSSEEISDVLRIFLLDALSDEGNISIDSRRKLASVGRKQIVLGPDVYCLGALLIAAYIAYKGQGKQKETQTITIDEAPDGRRKITIKTETIYINPLNPLAGLIERIFKREV